MSTLLIVLLVLLLIGAFGSYPAWPHSTSWGYAPFGGILGLLLVIVLILAITGNLHI